MNKENNIKNTENFYVNNRKDYSVVKNSARIAVYDDLKSPPKILEISPDATNTYIESLSSKVYDEVRSQGGNFPYTVIREIIENFIHADFSEIVISILDKGNTVRFSDQGPGFSDINNAQLPGFTSATESMKQYIRGVGSGLPTVKDYLSYSDGFLKIENNLSRGAVVTISMLQNLKDSSAFSEKDKQNSEISYKNKINKLTPNLNLREKNILKLIFTEGALGVTEISKFTQLPVSSVHKILSSLEQAALIQKITDGKKRILSEQGFTIIDYL